jgi:exodeoxyribonuclease-5
MYRAVEDPKTGKVEFGRKPLEEIDSPSNKLIAVDEASMLSEPIWNDLVRTATALKCNVLLIGDPFQLPPVDPEATKPFCCLEDSFPANYRANLTEIVRQALDSPIIKASMYIRKGDIDSARDLLPNLERMEAWRLTLDICKKTDGVIICHKNVTRHKVNAGVRTELGMPKALSPGEPLLILKNCYEANVYNGEVLPFPGWTWESDPVEVTDKYRNLTQKTRFGATTFNNAKVLLAHERIRGNMEEVGFGAIAYTGIRTYYADKPAEPVYKGYGRKAKRGPRHPFLDANFGYCLTAHRSQGSEWKRVLVVAEPSIRIGTQEGLRWLYTAVTRAKETVSLYWS